jgi:UPF0271 protein
MKVLLNCDFGLGETPETATALLGLVDLANLAYGDRNKQCDDALARLASEVLAQGRQTGALVGGGGEAELSARELTERMAEGIGHLQLLLKEGGGTLGHVKMHEALACLCDQRTDLAEACVDWMESELEGVPLIVRAGGLLHAVAEARGVPLMREIFAARSYDDEANVLPCGNQAARIDDPARVVERISDWKASGYLPVGAGKKWLVEAETVCVAADFPESVAVARGVREVLGGREVEG